MLMGPHCLRRAMGAPRKPAPQFAAMEIPSCGGAVTRPSPRLANLLRSSQKPERFMMLRWDWIATLAAVAVLTAAPAAQAQTALTKGVAVTGLSGAVNTTRSYSLIMPKAYSLPG